MTSTLFAQLRPARGKFNRVLMLHDELHFARRADFGMGFHSLINRTKNSICTASSSFKSILFRSDEFTVKALQQLCRRDEDFNKHIFKRPFADAEKLGSLLVIVTFTMTNTMT